MRLKYSESAVPLRKKKSGHVFQSNFYGYSAITHQRNDRFRYDNQFNQKRYLIAATSRWRELSESEKQNWLDFAAAIPQPCKFEASGFLSGYQCFVKRQSFEFFLNGFNSPLMGIPSQFEISSNFSELILTSSADQLLCSYSFSDLIDSIYCVLFVSRVDNSSVTRNFTGTRFCSFFDNSFSAGKTFVFGTLYNQYTAVDSRLPSSPVWRVPLRSDILTLSTNLGGQTAAGGKMKLNDLNFWVPQSPIPSNSSFFSAKGSGFRNELGGFQLLKSEVQFWSKTVDSLSQPFTYYLKSAYPYLFYGYQGAGDRVRGRSIRLVSDGDPSRHGEIGTYTGNDLTVYPTINIFGQVWLSESLVETKFSDNTIITIVTSATDWRYLTTPACCYYNNLESNSFVQSTVSKNITNQYKNFFGVIPSAGDCVRFRLVSFAKTSGQFFEEVKGLIQIK